MNVDVNAIAWAEGHAPDRSVLAGVVGIRCFEYTTQDLVTPSLERVKPRAIAGLEIRSDRSGETAVFHTATGIYGFLHLGSGTHRIHISDPSGRYLPRALELDAPDRSGLVSALERGAAPPPAAGAGFSPPLYRDVAMRIAPGFLSPAPLTLLWGEVRHDNGTAAPLARLQFRTKVKRDDGTRVNGRVITHADSRGAYQAWLADEQAEFDIPDPPAVPTLQRVFDRKVERVNVLKPDALAALRSDRPLRGVPLSRHLISPASAGTPYEPSATFQLWKDGLPPAVAGSDEVEIEIGRRRRWDVVIT